MPTATLIPKTQHKTRGIRFSEQDGRDEFAESLRRMIDCGEGPESDELARQCMEAFYQTPVTTKRWDEAKKQAALLYGDTYA